MHAERSEYVRCARDQKSHPLMQSLRVLNFDCVGLLTLLGFVLAYI